MYNMINNFVEETRCILCKTLSPSSSRQRSNENDAHDSDPDPHPYRCRSNSVLLCHAKCST